MASEQDNVLAVSEHSSEEFSGFSQSEVVDVPVRGKKKLSKKPSLKVKDKKVKDKSKGIKPTEKQSGSNIVQPGPSIFDITSLCFSDIVQLRNLLGIKEPQQTCTQQNDVFASDDDLHSYFGYQLDNLPKLSVEFDPQDLSGGESPRPKPKNISTDLSSALFSSEKENVQETDDWDLPKLKIPEKGKPIAKSLEELINTACTSQ